MKFTLGIGGHADGDGFCLMEAVACATGQRHTDHPIGVDADLASHCRQVNDALSDRTRQVLVSLIQPIINTLGVQLSDAQRGSIQRAATRVQDHPNHASAVAFVEAVRSVLVAVTQSTLTVPQSTPMEETAQCPLKEETAIAVTPELSKETAAACQRLILALTGQKAQHLLAEDIMIKEDDLCDPNRGNLHCILYRT